MRVSAFRFALLLVLGWAACAGCTGVRVSTDYDPAFDFTGSSSYAWIDTRSGVQGDRPDVVGLLDRRIRAAVDRELGGRGFSEVDREAAELLVAYRLAIETKLDVDTYTAGVGYGRGWYGRAGSTQTVVREYEEGTLLIDVVDAASNQLVWRGSGQARVQEASGPEKRTERVRDAVARILEGFPPGASP